MAQPRHISVAKFLTLSKNAVKLSPHFHRYKIGIQYRGDRHTGWCGNDDGSVFSVESALKKMLNKFVGAENYENFKGSSRTDRGVHSIRNVAHVDIIRRKDNEVNPLPFDPIVMKVAMNFHLEANEKTSSVVITDVSLADETFDARLSATGRTYLYRIIYSKQSDVQTPPFLFNRDYAWFISKKNFDLDIDKMQMAANMLLGEHDFSSFRNSSCQSSTPYRNITQLSIAKDIVSSDRANYAVTNEFNVTSQLNLSLSQKLLANDLQVVTFVITANSFLLKMVRNIVGTLFDVGSGKLTIEQFRDVFQVRDRSLNRSRTAPAEGLFLMDVHYDTPQDPSSRT